MAAQDGGGAKSVLSPIGRQEYPLAYRIQGTACRGVRYFKGKKRVRFIWHKDRQDTILRPLAAKARQGGGEIEHRPRRRGNDLRRLLVRRRLIIVCPLPI